MTISTGYSGKIYGYVIPYNSSTSLYGFEFDTVNEELTAVEYKNSASQAEYASSQIHFTADGKMVYVNDSGKLFCVSYANDVEVVYSEERILTQTVARGYPIAVDPSVDKYYTNVECTDEFDPTTPITAEMTLYVTLRDWYVDDGVFHYVKGEIPDYTITTIPWIGETFTSVIIYEGITSIGACAFYGFDGIESVTVAASVTSIDEKVFYGCSGLKNVTFVGNIPTIGDMAFFGSGLTYDVIFVSDGNIYAKHALGYGETIIVPNMVKEGYTFNKWDIEIPATMPFNDITATASWTINKYNVTWSVDGTETIEPYEYGQTPAFAGSTDKPADDKYTYTFAGWDSEIEQVSGDVTYTAQYTKELNTYTVKFLDDLGRDCVPRQFPGERCRTARRQRTPHKNTRLYTDVDGLRER